MCFNKTFKNLAQQFNYPTVPIVGEYSSFFEAVKANEEWMVEGRGEGLIVVSADSINKWKIGAEANSTNIDLINATIEQINKDDFVFGEETKRINDLLTILRKIQVSTVTHTVNPDEEYEIAIKSAMTKFDHHDAFEYEQYVDLIVKETLIDIKVGDEKATQEKHRKKVQKLLNDKFSVKKK